MKNIFESGEVFEAYARIDLRYYGIEQLSKDLNKPRSPLEIMIDEQTGYGKEKNRKDIKTAIELIKGIIADKKIIEADYSGDEKFLNELRNNLPMMKKNT